MEGGIRAALVALIFMDITDLYAYENYATFKNSKQLKLRWDNKAIIEAIRFVRFVDEIECTYGTLIQKLSDGELSAVIACLYGALKSADESMSISKFNRIYNEEMLHEYIEVAYEGVKEYLPKPVIDDPMDDLDETYPDTQSELKKKKKEKVLTGSTTTGLHKNTVDSPTKNSKKHRKEP